MGKMKIIGTGLSGLVGSRVQELLKDKYQRVDFSLDSGVNILDKKGLATAFEENKDARAVLHLAAFTDTGAAWEQRGDKKGLCYRLNVLGTRNIIQFCQKYRQYLIYISTDFVFSGRKRGQYTEKDKPDPIEWYGQTKYWAEKEVLESGLPAAVVRIAFPFRSYFEAKKDIVRRIIDGLREKSLYPMFADQIITPTFIDDIAFDLDYFLENKPQGIYHLVGPQPVSPYQLARLIARLFGFDPKEVKKGSLLAYQKNQPPGSRPWQKNLAISNRKITSLGLKITSLKEALLRIKGKVKGTFE